MNASAGSGGEQPSAMRNAISTRTYNAWRCRRTAGTIADDKDAPG
jgi:hypothetical protein